MKTPIETNDFDYPLAHARIAQFPTVTRTASRLLAVSKGDCPATDNAPPIILQFAEIGKLLQPGDLLVANNTRVLPARLFARKPTGGKVEILLERMLDGGAALVQLRTNKPVRIPQMLLVGSMKITTELTTELTVTDRRNEFFIIESEHGDLAALFQSHGIMPLPPYIKRDAGAQDLERYQTVYSRINGAVAAPTAGLHFDQALIDDLRRGGIHWATITLHIGAATFQPVRSESPTAHAMHYEWMEVNQSACAAINQTKSRGGRIIAIGTTVVRALETAAQSTHGGKLQPFCGDTNLFILPGHHFHTIDALITNFHLPRSTLLMLTCAFAGYAKTMRAYQHAIDHDFRFYSYGDAMFVERQGGTAGSD